MFVNQVIECIIASLTSYILYISVSVTVSSFSEAGTPARSSVIRARFPSLSAADCFYNKLKSTIPSCTSLTFVLNLN